jgi:hypothetical protein
MTRAASNYLVQDAYPYRIDWLPFSYRAFDPRVTESIPGRYHPILRHVGIERAKD